MGSFKEYYEDVGNFQKALPKEEEIKILTKLSDIRYSLKDAIYSADGVGKLILNMIGNLSSIASVTDNFNSNKKGNNSKVEERVKECLIIPISSMALHLCNFRMDWLIDEVLPKLKIDKYTLNWINVCKEEIKKLENRLIESCLKMAVKLAMENRGRLAHEDAVQTANLALVEAVRSFNPKIGVRFNTYAHHKILFRMRTKLMEDPFGIVHVPRSADAEEGTGSWLSLEEDIDVGRNRSLSEILPDDSPGTEELVDITLIRESLKESLGRFLTDQEAEVIYYRYLFSGKTLTYQEVSDQLPKPLTRERIRQIEEKALNKLKTKPELRELLSFYRGH